MPTISAGSVASVFCPLASTITITPGSAGRVSMQTRSQTGGQSVLAQEIYSATTISVSSGDTVTMEAVNTDATYSGVPSITGPGGELYGLAETTPYVNATASAGATVFSGACELAGWYCSVAAGNITIYDALSATGTPIVPTTALTAGPMPIFGAGTNGKLALATGCHVVLSGAATVRVLVA